MNWLDAGILTVFILAVLLEAKRGFGSAMFDFAALLLTAWGLSRIEPLWRSAGFVPHVHALVYALSFLILGGVLVVIGRLAHQSTLISVAPFDKVLAGMLGVGAAIVLCYGIVHVVALTGGTEGLPPVLSSSLLAKEFVTFDTYHRVLYVLQHFGNTQAYPG